MTKITDLLLGAAQAAVSGGSFTTEQKTFRERHKQATAALIKSQQRRSSMDERIDAAADELGSYLPQPRDAAPHTPRILDMTAARGERMLAQIFCEIMQDRGIDAVYIDATRLIKVERQYGSPFPDLEASTKNVEDLIIPCLETRAVSHSSRLYWHRQ